jgi:hypothetical protein
MATPVRATTLAPLTVAQLSRHAVTVAAGTVVSVRTRADRAGAETVVRLRVAETLKGAGARFLTLRVPGGTLPGGRRWDAGGMPSFAVGESKVVFVDVFGRVLGGFQGALAVRGGRVAPGGVSLDAFGRGVRAAVARGAAQAATGRQAWVSDGGQDPGRPDGTARASRLVEAGSLPTITGITPTAASAGTGDVVTIEGSGFGSSRGVVYFSYGRNGTTRIAADSIASWSDTSIRCTVPTALVSEYTASASTGPVVVETSSGVASSGFSFDVLFGYGSAKWAGSQATFRVNSSGVDDALRTGLVDAGASLWNATGTGFTFVDGGPTTAGVTPDGSNVVSWASGLPYGVLAMSYSSYPGGVMAEADIQFSNDMPWGDGSPGSGTYDIESIAAHELGHWLVLLDLYMIGDADKVMYGYARPDVQKRALTSADIAGIRWIYGGQTASPTPSPTATPTPSATPTASATPTPTPTPTAVDAGPVCSVRDARARLGGTAAIRYTVKDDLDPHVVRSISISTVAGVVKRKWTGVVPSSAAWQSFSFRCDLRRGSYRITVRATDLAGHPASVTGRATLTVW